MYDRETERERGERPGASERGETGERERQRERERQTDRQTDRQTERQREIATDNNSGAITVHGVG